MVKIFVWPASENGLLALSGILQQNPSDEGGLYSLAKYSNFFKNYCNFQAKISRKLKRSRSLEKFSQEGKNKVIFIKL